MKYIKTYEDINTDVEEDDYVVGYRPYKKQYDNIEPVVINFEEYVIEVGSVNKVFWSPKIGTHFSIVFPGGRYIRLQKHILFHSKNKEDAEEYLQMLKDATKYNL